MHFLSLPVPGKKQSHYRRYIQLAFLVKQALSRAIFSQMPYLKSHQNIVQVQINILGGHNILIFNI
jgi:hypothetical protein